MTVQKQSHWKTNLRVVWAIAYKDILDALKNRTTLAIMLGVGLVMLNGHALPLLLGIRDIPKAVVYDPGRSELAASLRGSDDYALVIVDDRDEMEEWVADSAEVWLGIELPDDFDQSAGSGDQVALIGSYIHWADRGLAAERAAYFEELLTRASWSTVRIDLEAGGALYPTIGTGGWLFMLALTMTIALITLGVILVPHLMVEEKERHTIDVLLVSPASLGQIIAGKALVGLFYCASAALITLIFDARYIVHWEVMLLAVLLGAVCAVMIGLLLGVLYDSPSTVNMWAAMVIAMMIVPAFMQEFISSKWPAFIEVILPYIPSVAISNLVRWSMVGTLQARSIWTSVLVLSVWSGIFFVLVLRQLRRIDR
jgi:ABC-type transport system involved in multi-copper enzyme maturation permease subunit